MTDDATAAMNATAEIRDELAKAIVQKLVDFGLPRLTPAQIEKLKPVLTQGLYAAAEIEAAYTHDKKTLRPKPKTPWDDEPTQPNLKLPPLEPTRVGRPLGRRKKPLLPGKPSTKRRSRRPPRPRQS